MIPYSIQHVSPSDDIRDDNINIIYDCIEYNKLDEKIIDYIIDFIYDFFDYESEYNIKITSYEDFCNTYWKKTEFKIRGWNNIFRVYYFRNTWMKWNLEEYTEQIYNAYINKYII